MTDDLAAIATIGVAIATGVLAVATFLLARAASKTLEEEKQQLRMLTYQARAVRSQMDPLLKLHSWSFKRNKLSVEVENLGPGRAFWLVVRSWFDPTSMITRAEENGPPLSDEEIKSLLQKVSRRSGSDQPDSFMVRISSTSKAGRLRLHTRQTLYTMTN